MSAPALLEQVGEPAAAEPAAEHALMPARSRLAPSWLMPLWRAVCHWIAHPLVGRLILLAALLGIVLAVPPTGAFPVDDDWIYAQSVQQLLTDGVYHRSVWIDSAFLAQAWWGAAVSWLFGFSHTTLRLSTLALAAGAAFLFHALLRRALTPLPALAVTLLLVFHPLFLHLSYSFMTDVPFLAIMLAALWCVTVATEDHAGAEQPVARMPGARMPGVQTPGVPTPGTLRLGWLAAGSALIGLACLVRQIGVVLVPAVLLATLPELRAAQTSRVARTGLLAALVLPFSIVVALLVYADPRDVTVEVRLLEELRASDPATLLQIALRAAGAAALLIGLSGLPSAPPILSRPGIFSWTRWQRGVAAGLLILLFVAVWARAGDGHPFSPLFGNTLSAAGLTLSGLHPRAIALPDEVRLMLVGGALLGSIALIVALVGLPRGSEISRVPLPIRLLVLASLGALAVTLGYGPLAGPVNGLYDRYLLPVLPGALALAGYAIRQRRLAAPLLLIGVLSFGSWSVNWQQEYLQRQTAVWQVAETLVAQGVSPTEIDAGYEWNGWYRGPAVIEQARLAALASGDSRSFVQLVVDSIYAPRRWFIRFGQSDQAKSVPPGPGCSGRPLAAASYQHNGTTWPVDGLRRCGPGGNGPQHRAPESATATDPAPSDPQPATP
jgi:4-amino-4-deoxy-L-arabinose transferase-like glycosyltransferase